MFFAAPDDFRAWLAEHHETERELLVGFHKRGSGRPSITWPESVDAALSFGWIDGVRRSIDEHSYSIRFTPRKRTSIWSAVNVARVAELVKSGKMAPAGLRAFAARTPERTGVYSFERNVAARLTAAQEKALRANRKAAAFFDGQAPWYQRAAIHWIVSAKRDETKERRLAQLIADSAAGREIPPLRRPAGTKGKAAASTRKGRAAPRS
jgi:uncharacterized protein YdeI (YjbR/CyaY-like superfamily)